MNQDRISGLAQDAAEKWIIWCNAEGWDNKEYSALADAMREIVKELGIEEKALDDGKPSR